MNYINVSYKASPYYPLSLASTTGSSTFEFTSSAPSFAFKLALGAALIVKNEDGIGTPEVF